MTPAEISAISLAHPFEKLRPGGDPLLVPDLAIEDAEALLGMLHRRFDAKYRAEAVSGGISVRRVR